MIAAHVDEALWANAVQQNVMGCMQVEAFFDFGVRGEEDVQPTRLENEDIQCDVHPWKHVARENSWIYYY